MVESNPENVRQTTTNNNNININKVNIDKNLKRMINILDEVVEETSQDYMDLTTITQTVYSSPSNNQ